MPKLTKTQKRDLSKYMSVYFPGKNYTVTYVHSDVWYKVIWFNLFIETTKIGMIVVDNGFMRIKLEK